MTALNLHLAGKLLLLAGVSDRCDGGKVLDDPLGVDRLPSTGLPAEGKNGRW